MSWDPERLYALLPAIYQIRDQAQGEPLKALLAAIAEQVALLDEDLEQLYDDQFIETCADWVAPYLGDLIGYQPIHHPAALLPSPRAEVANTIAYRRRKGTAVVLEQLAVDVTGWKAHAVEFFQQVITTPYLNHVRPEHIHSPDLRQWRPLEQLDTAFNEVAHTVDVRRIASSRGKYNVPNVGLFLWRLQAYPVTSSTVRVVQIYSLDLLCYRFHPLGIDSPLFNFPRTENSITQLSQPINVPHSLSRRVLYEELEALRQSIADRLPPKLLYFQRDRPAFEVFLNGDPVPSEEVLICNLTRSRIIPNTKTYQTINGDEILPIQLPIQVAVDPVLGRLALPPASEIPERIEVSYSYGFSADIGGGPYSRQDSVFSSGLRWSTADLWQVGVSQNLPESSQIKPSLRAAITAWNDEAAPGKVGIIAIMDSRTYTDTDLPAIKLPAESQLLIVAADWPIADREAPPEQQRLEGQLAPSGVRPHIIGNLTFESIEDTDPQVGGELLLNGLLVEGSIQLQDVPIKQLSIDHCTIMEGIDHTLDREPLKEPFNLKLNNSITGPIRLFNQEGNFVIRNSILDRELIFYRDEMTGDRQRLVIDALRVSLDIQTCTVLGRVQTRTIEASNCIFYRQVTAVRRQTGCVRFSYLPHSSRTPQQYRCQPSSEAEAIRIQPQFTSLRYGDPSYAQLSRYCPPEICQGADDEAEMGAFHDLYQPQRESNLRTRLDEYLRYGLEAGIFYTT